MSDDRLWAPWRMAYIQGETKDAAAAPPPRFPMPPASDHSAPCFICHHVAERSDRENLVVHRGAHTITLLNRYPYNNGHLLIAPQRHQSRLDEISAETQAETQVQLARLVSLVERLMRADGFNIGLNLGRVAGAGVPGHLHWHLVPRWSGDANFMPVVGNAKVISQSLEAVWELLTPELADG